MDLVKDIIQSLEELNRQNSTSVFDRMFHSAPTSEPLVQGYVDVFWRKVDDDRSDDFKNFDNNIGESKVVCIGMTKTYMHYGDHSCSHFTNRRLIEYLVGLLKKGNGFLGESTVFVLQSLFELEDEIRLIERQTGELEECNLKRCKFIHGALQFISECIGSMVYFMENNKGYVLSPDCYRNKVFLLKGIAEVQSKLEAARTIGEDDYLDEDKQLLETLNEINEFGLSCYLKVKEGVYPLFTLRITNRSIPYIDILNVKSITDLDDLDSAEVKRFVTCYETLMYLSKYCQCELSKEDVSLAMEASAVKNYALPFIVSQILRQVQLN